MRKLLALVLTLFALTACASTTKQWPVVYYYNPTNSGDPSNYTIITPIVGIGGGSASNAVSSLTSTNGYYTYVTNAGEITATFIVTNIPVALTVPVTGITGTLSASQLPSTNMFDGGTYANLAMSNSFTMGPFVFQFSTNILVSTNAGTAAANGNWFYTNALAAGVGGYTNFATLAYRKFTGGQWSTYNSTSSELYRGTNGVALGVVDTPINGLSPGPGFAYGWIFSVNTGTMSFNVNAPIIGSTWLSPTIFGGTLTGPVVTGGIFSGPGVNNGIFTYPAVFGGSFTNPAVFGGSFTNPAVFGGSFTYPAVFGGSFTNPAVFGGSFTNPTIFGGTFAGNGTLVTNANAGSFNGSGSNSIAAQAGIVVSNSASMGLTTNISIAAANGILTNAPYYFLTNTVVTPVNNYSHLYLTGATNSPSVPTLYYPSATIGGQVAYTNGNWAVVSNLVSYSLGGTRFAWGVTNLGAGVYYRGVGVTMGNPQSPTGTYTTNYMPGVLGTQPFPTGSWDTNYTTNITVVSIVTDPFYYAATNILFVQFGANNAFASRTNHYPFASIGLAVSNALPGDLVLVGNGTFYEGPFTIPFNVTVRGSSRRSTLIFPIGSATNLYLSSEASLENLTTAGAVVVAGTNCTLENVDVGAQNYFPFDPLYALAAVGSVDGFTCWNSSFYCDGEGVNFEAATGTGMAEFFNCKLWDDFDTDNSGGAERGIISGAYTIRWNGGSIEVKDPFTNQFAAALVIGGNGGPFTNGAIELSGVSFRYYNTNALSLPTPVYAAYFANSVNGSLKTYGSFIPPQDVIGGNVTVIGQNVNNGSTNLTAATSFTASFSKPFADTNYTATASGNGIALASMFVSAKTTNSCVFNFAIVSGNVDWQVVHQ